MERLRDVLFTERGCVRLFKFTLPLHDLPCGTSEVLGWY